MRIHLAALALLFTIAVTVSAASCTSTPEGDAPEKLGKVRVTALQVKTGHDFELVNGSAEERVELYSQVSASASRKVTTHEVMGALLEALDTLGFDELAQPGAGPKNPGPDVGFVIEVARGDSVSSVVEYSGQPTEERARIREMFQNVIFIWNDVYGLQTVEGRPGEDIFQQPLPRSR